MAKNLRTILPVTDMAVGRYRGQSLFWKPGPEGYSSGAGQKCSTYSVGGIDRMNWAVPTGSRIATFEIWGGGGQGAGARCCQQGIPGGAGAYARKTIKVTPGDTYVFCTCIAVHCCYYTESNHNRSQRGGKTYVIGNNLNNFCAEGGNPGATCCWFFSSYRHNEYMYMCDLLARSIGDSDTDYYNRACFYGTNHGTRGVYGWAQTSCCGSDYGADAHVCGFKTGIPFPGGSFMWGRAMRGGVVHKGLSYGCHCYYDLHDGCSGRSAHSAVGGGWYSRMPGEGGTSAATFAGPCCCGSQGAFGAVRVTWE